MTPERAMAEPEIRDNPEAARYEILIEGDLAGFVDYHLADGALAIPRTVTLPAHRGRGVAATLVRHVMDEARRDGRRVTTTCWYVQDWLAAHPEYRDVSR